MVVWSEIETNFLFAIFLNKSLSVGIFFFNNKKKNKINFTFPFFRIAISSRDNFLADY